ncbi:MAG TPA: DUF4880 domain-containing protein, partial [Steroidobacteraceae bacterium]
MSQDPSDWALIEAARWRIRLAESPLDSGDGFRRWLAADPRNGEAWSQVQSAWSAVECRATSAKLVRWRQDALAYVRRSAESRGASRSFRRSWILGLGAAAGLTLL